MISAEAASSLPLRASKAWTPGFDVAAVDAWRSRVIAALALPDADDADWETRTELSTLMALPVVFDPFGARYRIDDVTAFAEAIATSLPPLRVEGAGTPVTLPSGRPGIRSQDALLQEFSPPRLLAEGYDADEVDVWLDSVIATLRAHQGGDGNLELRADELATVSFRRRRGRSAYDAEEVDAFMARVIATLRAYESRASQADSA